MLNAFPTPMVGGLDLGCRVHNVSVLTRYVFYWPQSGVNLLLDPVPPEAYKTEKRSSKWGWRNARKERKAAAKSAKAAAKAGKVADVDVSPSRLRGLLFFGTDFTHCFCFVSAFEPSPQPLFHFLEPLNTLPLLRRSARTTC